MEIRLFTMVIIRMGDSLLHAPDDFLCKVVGLDNNIEWMPPEREFRFCRSVRVALRETTADGRSEFGCAGGALYRAHQRASLGRLPAYRLMSGMPTETIGDRKRC